MIQDTLLLYDSIRTNLRIAKLDVTDERIEAACKKTSIHDFIVSPPQGYDTPVGELGDTLTGRPPCASRTRSTPWSTGA